MSRTNETKSWCIVVPCIVNYRKVCECIVVYVSLYIYCGDCFNSIKILFNLSILSYTVQIMIPLNIAVKYLLKEEIS
jgi:hypothetical protein